MGGYAVTTDTGMAIKTAEEVQTLEGVILERFAEAYPDLAKRMPALAAMALIRMAMERTVAV